MTTIILNGKSTELNSSPEVVKDFLERRGAQFVKITSIKEFVDPLTIGLVIAGAGIGGYYLWYRMQTKESFNEIKKTLDML